MSDMYSKYQRVFSVQVDRLGVDPLLDRLVPRIQSIQQYTVHHITQEERASPDLISINEYGSDDFWWMIMAYNGIGSYVNITEGKSLKIPNFGALVAIVTENAIRPNKVSRVITI
jgi:hypothetical protein